MTIQNHVVMSLHGIRTRGIWQKELVPHLAKAGFIPDPHDYGNFGALRLLRKASLDAQVESLLAHYDRVTTEQNCRRPSVIAHSFGTLQIARLLAKHNHVNFDKVILAASIIPLDYPWNTLLTNSRVNWVVNDYGGKDRWPKIAARLVPGAGRSGSEPFIFSHRALDQVSHPDFGHSDYFSAGNFRRNWIPTLLLNKRKIVDDLNALIGMLTPHLQVRRESLRCFVLAKESDEDRLNVVPGLHLGDISKQEVLFSVSLDAIGIEAAPAVAFKQMREVRQNREDLVQLAESLGTASPLNKHLAWSMSMPIPNGADTRSAIGVLIIDGVQEYAAGALAKDLMSEQNVYEILSRLGLSLCKVYPR
ncbi:MAG TPA: hypothetical protein VGA09_09345 [Candidatus Binatia bacterium]